MAKQIVDIVTVLQAAEWIVDKTPENVKEVVRDIASETVHVVSDYYNNPTEHMESTYNTTQDQALEILGLVEPGFSESQHREKN